MATFSLDDIRAAAEAKYGSTDIDLGEDGVLVLTNPLRLPKEKRKALSKMQDMVDEAGEDNDADQGDALREAIRIVATDSVKAEKFLAYAGDDLAILATVFDRYSEGTQVGEASASQG